MNYIGSKRLWYGAPLTAKPTKETIATANAGLTEVTNVHNDTWGYDESDATIQEYVNQLTGNTYFKDVEKQGVPTITFTMGDYEFSDKKELQGGESDADSWSRPNTPGIIEKCVVALTKTGSLIVFPKAAIVGKGSMAEKNIGLSVSATPVEISSTIPLEM